MFAFLEHGDGAAQFIQPGDHRKHDLYVADSAGTQDSAQLRFENVLILETKPDRAPAEEWVQLISDVCHTLGKFIATQIECANNERIRADLLSNASISFVLLLLRRQSFAV